MLDETMLVYIHIPFCVKKCGYCDFLSFPIGQYGDRRTALSGEVCGESVPEEYLRKLILEICRESGSYAGRTVDTVFIGGGTPSLLTSGQAAALLDGINQSFRVASDAEISMEANPGTLTKEKLKGYRRAGINRLSIGLQSADDMDLAALGRIHRFRDFEENFKTARECGFENINIDLMSGLPGQSVDSWLYTLHKAVGFQPEHISAYGLIIEEGTAFYERYGRSGVADREDRGIFGEGPGREAEGVGSREAGKGWEKLPSEEAERQMYHETGNVLKEYGYRQYEISNYAKPGYECRHNIGYWTRKEYAGFGLGAASMIDNVRWKNTSDMKEYLNNAAGRDKTRQKDDIRESVCFMKEDVQVLTLQEQMEETMFLGLRMNRGVSKAEFKDLYGVRIEEVYGTWLRRMAKEGLLLDEDSVYLSERGRDLANFVMAGFLID